MDTETTAYVSQESEGWWVKVDDGYVFGPFGFRELADHVRQQVQDNLDGLNDYDDWTCEGYNVRGVWTECTREDIHIHGILAD